MKIDINVHKELEKIKAQLIAKTENPNLTYSQVIMELIQFYKKHQKKE
ncbi:MAG: hypothetical protein QXH87_03990 [Candidatus Bathyarchaeia archaeon]